MPLLATFVSAGGCEAVFSIKVHLRHIMQSVAHQPRSKWELVEQAQSYVAKVSNFLHKRNQYGRRDV